MEETPGGHAHTEKVVTCKPKREASGETKSANTLILNFQPPSCEKISFCSLSHPVWVFCYGSPSKLICLPNLHCKPTIHSASSSWPVHNTACSAGAILMHEASLLCPKGSSLWIGPTQSWAQAWGRLQAYSSAEFKSNFAQATHWLWGRDRRSQFDRWHSLSLGRISAPPLSSHTAHFYLTFSAWALLTPELRNFWPQRIQLMMRFLAMATATGFPSHPVHCQPKKDNCVFIPTAFPLMLTLLFFVLTIQFVFTFEKEEKRCIKTPSLFTPFGFL